MSIEDNNIGIQYFYIKSPDLTFNAYSAEIAFSDSCSQTGEYCEDVTSYDY